jgi:predicted metal-binding membrane protein
VQAASHRSRFLPLMAALTATAWLTLWLWGQSPYGRYLDHDSWAEIGVARSLCRALPGGRGALTASLVVGGWVLMLAAMMLPTTLPLLDVFRRLTMRRADRRVLTTLVVIGYLAVWGVFGLAGHLADWGVVVAVRQSDWLVANVWVIGAAILAIAGGYQFTELKYRCLDRCRAPLGFVIEHWRGAREKRQALFLGVRHGAFCVG